MEIRRVQYEGTWFTLEGSKGKVASVTDQKIQEACQRVLQGLYPSSSETAAPFSLERKEVVTEGVTVRLLGSRSITPLHKAATEETKPSLLWQIATALPRLISWLFTRKKPNPEDELKLDMQLGMQLFATEDTALLEQLFSSDPKVARQDITKLPFSKVLHLWTATLSEAYKDDPDLANKLTA